MSPHRGKPDPANTTESIEHEDSGDQPISKSARKRQMHRLQAMGTALVDLAPGVVETLGLSDMLVDALELARNTKKHEALRRQLQFVGKLMRKEDPQVIERVEILLDNLQAQQQKNNHALHACERWRDLILEQQDQGVEKFIAEYPAADRQWLRQICRQHQQELAQQRPPVAARKLFAYLRETLQNAAQS